MATALAMACSIMVLPVRGGALISPALAFADRAEQIENAAGHVFLGRFHLSSGPGDKRRQVIEEDLVARDFRVFKIDGFQL